jgi:hypothetical protein
MKELTILAMASEPMLAESFELMWRASISLGNWFGFALYILYGVGLDYEFGQTTCDVYGYLYYVIDGMNYIVAFAAPAEDGSSGSSAADLLAAGSDALAGLGIDIPSEVTDAAAGAVNALGEAEKAL